MRRIRGLFVITRTLLPFLVVAALIVVTGLTTRALANATSDYSDELGEQLDGIQQAVAEANEGLEAIGGFVTSTVGAADQVLTRVNDLRSSIDIELPSVEIPDIEILDRVIDFPDFTLGDGVLEIPIPGVEPLQNFAGDVVAAGERVAEPIVKVAALADVPPQLEEAAADTAAYAEDVRNSLRGWFIAVVVVVLLAALVWAIAALRPIGSELARGWAMLRGRQAPERSVVDLESRVAALEERVG